MKIKSIYSIILSCLNVFFSSMTSIAVIWGTSYSTLSLYQNIIEITKIAFYHLRNIAKIMSLLSFVDAEILIHAFVSSRLDYCNASFSGLPRESTKSLQMVQNAAARLNTYNKIWSYYTNLNNQHWLPVHLRSDYKVLLMTYKTVQNCSSWGFFHHFIFLPC